MDTIASYFIEIKKRLDEQTIVLEKILATIEKTNQESFTETNDNPPVSISTDEERLMRRHGITKPGKKYYFGSYSYETLSDAIAYAEIHATKASTGNLAEQKEVSISIKIPEDIRKRVESMALDGNYSKTGIALATNISEEQIVKECIRLYRMGVLSSDKCERVIGRKLNIEEASAGQLTEQERGSIFSEVPRDIRKRVRSMALDGSYSKTGIALATNISEEQIEKICIRLYQVRVLTSDQCERVIGRKLNIEEASTGNVAEQKEVSISSKIPADKGGTMYCRNCGKEVKEKAEICPNCGVRPLAEKKFCQECGVDTNPSQEICIKCGIRLKTLIPIAQNGFPVNTDFSGLIPYYKEEFTRIYESNESYKGKWNWAAFFFGPIWALTKGVWLSAIICIPISVVTGGVAGIIYWFVFGFRGNYMYYARHVKDKQLPI